MKTIFSKSRQRVGLRRPRWYAHAVLARHRGDEWFVAGLNGQTASPQPVSISLGFLGPGRYDMSLITSGATPREFQLQTGEKSSEDTIALTMAAQDGFVTRFSPVP